MEEAKARPVLAGKCKAQNKFLFQFVCDCDSEHMRDRRCGLRARIRIPSRIQIQIR